jgi:hypothetical protein
MPREPWPVPGQRFLVARLPADGSFLLERSRTTSLRADFMEESRGERDGHVEVASLMVLRGIDSFERRQVLQELAARYRRIEDVPCDLPATTATLHRLIIGEKVVAARGLSFLNKLRNEFASPWSRIAQGSFELWGPLSAGSDGKEWATRLQGHAREAGIDVQTRIAEPSAEDFQVWQLLVERCG